MAITIIFLVMPHSAMAQVEWKDRYVTIAGGDQRNPQAAMPSNEDYTIVVWEDERPDSDGKNIYAQKIDNATGVALWWPPDGVRVCWEANDQRNPRAAYDSLGGVIIVWEDCREDQTNTTADIYATRLLLSSGALDPNWQIDGDPICVQSRNCSRPRIEGNGEGGFIVWIDERQGSNNRDVYMQYILSDARIAPGQWQTNGICVSVNSNPDQMNAEVARDYSWEWNNSLSAYLCGAVVAYQDNRNLSTSTGEPCWNTYLNRINSQGFEQYGQDVAATNAGVVEEQINPRLSTTGREITSPEPFAIVCWQDARDDPSSARYDIYAQVLKSDGARQGGNDGIEICMEDQGSQENPVMTVWEQPEIYPTQDYIPYAVIAWEDTRSGSGRDVYANLLDAANMSVLIQQGDAVCATANEKTELSIDHSPFAGSAAAYIAWRHDLSGGQGTDADIYYDRILIPSWTKRYAPYGWPVTEAKGVQSQPQVCGDMFVYEDARRQPIDNDYTEDWNIYCQRPGECVGPTDMDYRDMYVSWGNGTSAEHMRHVNDPSDNSVFIVWDEERDGVRSVFAQKLDKDGVPRWKNNGVRVSDQGETARNPDAAINTSGGAWIVWEQETGNGTRIHYAELDADGSFNCNPEGIDNQTSGDSKIPRVIDAYGYSAFSVDDGCIVAFLNDGSGDWKRYCANPPMNAYADAISNVTDGILSHDALLISGDYNGGCYLMTQGEDGNGILRINVAHAIYSGGTWASNPLTDQNEQSTLSSPSEMGGYDLCTDVFSSGAAAHHLMIAYSTRHPGLGVDIYVQRYDPLQMSQIAAGIPIYATIHVDDDHTNPSVTPDSTLWGNGYGGGYLLAWNMGYYPQPGTRRNLVATTQIGWYTPSVPDIPVIFFTVSGELPEDTHPDIARPSNLAPGLPDRSIIVWEGGYETSSCNPPRPVEIYAQYADYYTSYPLWQSEEMVAPGGGYYTQRKPEVSTSYLHSVSCLWMDDRAGSDGIFGARVTDAVGSIGWFKRPMIKRVKREAPHSYVMAHAYPNPVTNPSGEARIHVSAGEECIVEISVSDILGRTVVPPIRHEAIKGENVFTVLLPQSYPAGSYFVKIILPDGIEIKPLTLIR